MVAIAPINMVMTRVFFGDATLVTVFDTLPVFPRLPSLGKAQHGPRGLGEFHFEPFILRLQLLFILRDDNFGHGCSGCPYIPIIPPVAPKIKGLEWVFLIPCCPSTFGPSVKSEVGSTEHLWLDFHSQIKEGHKT